MRNRSTLLRSSVSSRAARLAGGAVVLAALAAGCSSATSAPGEQTGSNASAIVENRRAAFADADLALDLQLTDIQHSTFAVKEGQGTFTASPAFAEETGIAKETITIDPFQVGSGVTIWPVRIGADLTNLSAHIAGSSVVVSLPLTAGLHVSTPRPAPDFDLVVDSATLALSAGVDSNGAPVLYGASVDGIQWHIENCDGPLCLVVPAVIAGTQSMVSSAVAGALQKIFARPSSADTTRKLLLGAFNTSGDSDVGPGKDAWALATPPSFSIQDGAITFNVTRVLPPAGPPTGCVVSTACSGYAVPPSVSFHCDSTPETLELRLIGPSGNTKVIADNPEAMDNPSVGDAYPPWGTTASYVLCNVNIKGQACTAPIPVDVPPANDCSAGGGSHGPSSCAKLCPVCEDHGGTCVKVGTGCRCE